MTTTSSECVVAGGVHYGSEANHNQEETEIIMHVILYLLWSLSLDFTAFSITMHNIIFLLEVRFYQSITSLCLASHEHARRSGMW